MNVLDQLHQALGCRPSSLVEKGYPAERSDLDRLIGLRRTSNSSQEPVPQVRGIWPLISHHTFNSYNPFGLTAEGNLQKRTLMPLLAHHGIVASDPLVEVERLLEADQFDASLARLNTVIRQMAQVEPLVSAGLMRFESYRPTFTDQARRSVLNAFNVDTDFKRFTYLIEAYDAAKRMGRGFEVAYAQDVYELYDEVGQECPPLRNAAEGYQSVLALGEALIQVSWQFAVCSANPSCDITVTGDLEKRLFLALVSQWESMPTSEMIGKQLQRTRHFQRLSLGDLPNVNSMGLSVKDAVILRKHRVFEEFRGTLSGAIDDYELQLEKAGKGAASAAFEEVMETASHTLRNQSRQSSLKALAVGAIPATINAASTYVPPNIIEVHTASTTAAAIAVVAAWAIGTSKAKGHKVAVRYCLELGVPLRAR